MSDVESSRVSARWLNRGRLWVKNVGTAKVTDALKNSAESWPGTWTITHWDDKESTHKGFADQPGEGQEMTLTLAEHVQARREVSESIKEKGKADVVAHGTSKYGGSGDYEATSRTGFLLDVDKDPGAKGWQKIQELLNTYKIGFIGQRRTDVGKFHIEIPFSTPLEITGTDKGIWARQLGYILGILSEYIYSNDDQHQFDPLTDRLLQLVFLYTKRKPTDTRPETVLGEGNLAFNWLNFLVATDFPDAPEDEDISTLIEAEDIPEAPVEIVKRASSRLSQLPESIEGQGGHDTLWHAALILMRGFRLSIEQTRTLLVDEYNPRCKPEWSIKEIEHKIEGTLTATKVPWGYLLKGKAERAIEAALKKLLKKQELDEQEQLASRPMVRLTVDEHIVIDKMVKVLEKHPKVFHYAGNLVEVAGAEDHPDSDDDVVIRQPDTPYIKKLSPSRLQDLVCSVAQFEKWSRTDQEYIEAHPPQWLINGLEARGNWPGIHRLVGIGDSPVFLPNGDVPLVAGYHRSGIFASNGVHLEIKNKPTKDDAVRAAQRILELTTDFPFVETAHRSGILCIMLTLLSRYAINGPVPIALIEASTAGSGKSLSFDLISTAIFNRTASRSSYSPDDEEMRKKITSILSTGDRMILFDNIENGGTLKSSALDRVATSVTWSDRLLGTNNQFRGPVYTMFCVSGNNILVGGDLARRVMSMRLEPTVEHPELLTNFKFPELLKHVKSQRDQILSDLFTILRAFHEAGRPDQRLSGWGSFEAWSALPRAAIAWCGLPDPGESRTQFNEVADEIGYSGSHLLKELDVLMGDQPMTTKEILDACGNGYQDKRPNLKNAIEAVCNLPLGQKISPAILGHGFNKLRGRLFDGRILMHFGSRKANGFKWIIKKRK